MAVLVAIFLSFSLQAQMTDSKPATGRRPANKTAIANNASRPMNIAYGSPSWNTDSRKIDEAYMVMRDKNTGKMVQIQLEETEPDSSQFEGQFHVSLGERGLDPQVYVPPKELRNPERDYKKVHELIQSNKIESKPLIIKQNEKGQSVVDVYDTPDQAAAAQKVYEEQERLRNEAKRQKLVKQVPDKEKVKMAAEAEQKAALAKMALDAADREAGRVRLEQIERQRALEREKAALAASEQERAERRARAQRIGEEAMAHFSKGEFTEAEKKFRAAMDLDPQNKTFDFRYGVTLYRLDKFNEAIVVLKLAKVPPELEIERNYFLGLTYYRLKELDAAKAALRAASRSADPIMGPSSTFYLGVVQLAQEELEPAKASFERVIDTSQDPQMDNQAEQYIEQIAQLLMFKKLQEKRWTLTGTLGASYDSNVTYSPDQSSSASATKIDDLRLITVADVSYRAVYNPKHELQLKGNANMTNSRRDSAASADPWLFNFSVPYNYKTISWGKGHIVGFKPGYEMLYMAPSSTDTTKDKTLGSIIFDFDNTFVMRPNWFAVYTLQYRQDKFNLTSSTGDDNFDANKYALKTTQIMYLDKARKEALIANLGLTLNSAEGKNKTYNRIDFGATYARPMKWGYTWNLGLNSYQVEYGKSDPKRTDFNLAVSTGVDKPIRDWVTWSISGTFTKNDSTNETTYEYDKYVILTQAVFNTNL